MREKKPPDIYIRQYRTFKKKYPIVRKPFILVFAVIVVLAAGSAAYLYSDMWTKKPLPAVKTVQKETISIYSTTDQKKLTEKKIDITGTPGDKEKGEIIIKNLKTVKNIPEELVLYDLAIGSDSILYLNFSKNITEKETTAMMEILETFSIVNSFLATFRNANKVQFLVEGQPVHTLNGTVYTYKPLEFNQDLLED